MLRTPQTLRAYLPLVGFVVPTVVIGYGFVIPRSCIAGWNELTVGFAATVVGACLTYLAGVRLAARTPEARDGEA
jgi:ABC-type Fe3+ transport system permease subunit